MQALAFFVVGTYLFALLIVAIILHVTTKWRRAAAGRPFFLKDPSIPAGIRGLVLLQYGLAVVYAQALILRFIFPYEIDIFDVVYCLVFSVIALLSANGFARRSVNMGFKLGLALGWYCVAGVCLYLYREGWRPGIEWVTLTYGVLLLALLQWKYRPYFGVGEPRKAYRIAARVFRWGAFTIGFLVIAYVGSSLMVTTVFPPDAEEARAVLSNVADAMAEYKNEHGRWPLDLDQLDSSVDLRYRWKKVEFDPHKNELSLRVRIPIEKPDLGFRLTFGLQGRTEHIGSMGHRLK